MAKLTHDEMTERIATLKGQLNALLAQTATALEELAGLETLLGQVTSVRKPDLLLQAIEDNLRALVEQVNALAHLTLPPLAHTEEQVDEVDEDEGLTDDERDGGDEAALQEAESPVKVISVQPQGARFITLIGETHRIIDIPRTFAGAAAQLYEQEGGLDALIRTPSGLRKFAYMPLRFILARGGGFMFWKNIQAARRTLGELYKIYGKHQIRKSDPVSAGARRMHNRTRNRGLDRVDEVLARWEASLESDAAKFRIEVMVEMISKLLQGTFDITAEIPETRDEAFRRVFDEWQFVPLIIVQRTGAEGEEVATTFIRTLEKDISGGQSHFVDSLGWVITQIHVMRQGGSPSVNQYVEEQLKTAITAIRADDDSRWARIIDVLWRQYGIIESEVARKVTRFDTD